MRHDVVDGSHRGEGSMLCSGMVFRTCPSTRLRFANAAPVVLDMEDIEVLEVSQRNGLKTGLMVLLGAVAVIGSVTVGVIVARQ